MAADDLKRKILPYGGKAPYRREPDTETKGDRPDPSTELRGASRTVSGGEGTNSLRGGGGKRTLVVAPGDTLFGIAERELGDGNRWRDIARASNIRGGGRLSVGQKVTLPGARVLSKKTTGSPEAVQAVKTWQQFLANEGLYKGKVDGAYGPQTIAATKLLQIEGGLPPAAQDGIAGPQTYEVANKIAGGDWEQAGAPAAAVRPPGVPPVKGAPQPEANPPAAPVATRSAPTARPGPPAPAAPAENERLLAVPLPGVKSLDTLDPAGAQFREENKWVRRPVTSAIDAIGNVISEAPEDTPAPGAATNPWTGPEPHALPAATGTLPGPGGATVRAGDPDVPKSVPTQRVLQRGVPADAVEKAFGERPGRPEAPAEPQSRSMAPETPSSIGEVFASAKAGDPNFDRFRAAVDSEAPIVSPQGAPPPSGNVAMPAVASRPAPSDRLGDELAKLDNQIAAIPAPEVSRPTLSAGSAAADMAKGGRTAPPAPFKTRDNVDFSIADAGPPPSVPFDTSNPNDPFWAQSRLNRVAQERGDALNAAPPAPAPAPSAPVAPVAPARVGPSAASTGGATIDTVNAIDMTPGTSAYPTTPLGDVMAMNKSATDTAQASAPSGAGGERLGDVLSSVAEEAAAGSVPAANPGAGAAAAPPAAPTTSSNTPSRTLTTPQAPTAATKPGAYVTGTNYSRGTTPNPSDPHP